MSEPARSEDAVRVPDFDAVYAGNPDPWSVAGSFYEQRKLNLLLAALGRTRYRLGWDPGCGTGHLAVRLAQRCDQVIASDASDAAVQIARRTCADTPNVAVHRAPAQSQPGVRLPAAPDVVVLSEFLYYLEADDRAAVLAIIDQLAASDAELVGVHWRHHPHDAYISGADTQTEIITALVSAGWQHAVHLDDPDFVLDTLRRPG